MSSRAMSLSESIVANTSARAQALVSWVAAVLLLALRDWLGNGLFYAGLVLLGGLLMGERRRWVGVLAIANGVLGYLDLVFASALHLPPHTNFLLLVVWEVVLGFTWWRKASAVDAAQSGPLADREQMADGRGVQAGESAARS